MVVLPCFLFSSTGFSAESSEAQYVAMHKQLSIMSDIIQSSVTDKSNKHLAKVNTIDSTYLRGQGVIFTIDFSANKRGWREFNFNFSLPEMPVMSTPPIAPEVNKEFQEKYDIDVNETVTKALDSATADYEKVRDMLERGRDRAEELRDEQRDLAYELRDIEREKRDVNFQLSRASDERKTELKKALETLTQQEETLRAQQKKITQLVNTVAAEQKAKQAEKAKQRANYYQQLTLNLTETLCLYGNGLKALPENEHVSVILKSAGEKSAERYKDRIMVFNKQDIANCARDKITAEKLMSKSQTYQF